MSGYREKSEKKIKIGITVDKCVFDAIEKTRGTFDRSSFINDALYWGFVARDEEIEKHEKIR